MWLIVRAVCVPMLLGCCHRGQSGLYFVIRVKLKAATMLLFFINSSHSSSVFLNRYEFWVLKSFSVLFKTIYVKNTYLSETLTFYDRIIVFYVLTSYCIYNGFCWSYSEIKRQSGFRVVATKLLGSRPDVLYSREGTAN